MKSNANKSRCDRTPWIVGLMFVLCLPLTLSAQESTSNNSDQIGLREALAYLSQKHKVYFSYDIESLSDMVVAKSDLAPKNVKKALSQILDETDLLSKSVGKNNYVIYKNRDFAAFKPTDGSVKLSEKILPKEIPTTKIKKPGPTIKTLEIGAVQKVEREERTITGDVADEQGTPLIGVAIVVQDHPGLGTATDLDGKFSLRIPDENVTLILTYIGYRQVTEFVEDQLHLSIVMSPDFQTLDEVVVVGFGTQKKRFTTGAISKVDSEELENVAQTTVESSLQGKIAGVMVTTSDAMAGSPVTVRIRGTSSIVASSEPLYVVDGIPVVSGNYSKNNASSWRLATAHESNALSQLNPSDIESIEVLKDASAAAIYGSRGANGVVLITTKRGQAGKTKFDVGYQTGFFKGDQSNRNVGRSDLSTAGSRSLDK